MDKISKHIGSENGILYELFQLHLNEKSINYSDELKKMCIQIHEESRKSYEILHENIPLLPPTKEIEDYLRTSAEQFSTSVSDLDKMKSIVAEFKQQYKINNTTKVYAMLAVDALFSNPMSKSLKMVKQLECWNHAKLIKKHLLYFRVTLIHLLI